MPKIKVAMLADVHFHDVFGDFDFAQHNEVTIRSMQASASSTRMFNEGLETVLSNLA